MSNKHQQLAGQNDQTSFGPSYELAYILKDNSCKVSSEKYWTRRSAELQGKRVFKQNKNIIGIHVRHYEETFNDARGLIDTIVGTVATFDLESETWIEK